jgi:ABC-2 type transport system ATP-binding protein
LILNAPPDPVKDSYICFDFNLKTSVNKQGVKMNQPVIEIHDLTKQYGKARGIDHVNLDIREGEIFGFIGPNGAGKSTTIRILLNLIFPSGGWAKIMGMDVIRKTKEIKKKTGYIPSDANAYPSMRVFEFLSYCLRYYDIRNGEKRIHELCDWFELASDRRISDLSMGNRKKVSIVQSLLHQPELLILDEPTTGLDPLMQEKFFEIMRRENSKGMTIFFSSHNLSEVQLFCKRVAIIKEGKIIRVEDIETLRKKQLKRVHIEFEKPLSKEYFTIPGIENILSGPGNTLSFVWSGDINQLVSLLAAVRILDLTVEEPSLEEIFLHYYK